MDDFDCEQNSFSGNIDDNNSQNVRKSGRTEWTAGEEEYFIHCIEPYIGIINERDHKKATLADKSKAWREIQLTFNAQFINTSKTTEQLKIKWKNLQKRSKNKIASAKKARMATGGGPPVPPASDLDEQVISLVRTELMPFHNPYDSDAGHHLETETINLEDASEPSTPSQLSLPASSGSSKQLSIQIKKCRF